jgi:hypothetical protein
VGNLTFDWRLRGASIDTADIGVTTGAAIRRTNERAIQYKGAIRGDEQLSASSLRATTSWRKRRRIDQTRPMERGRLHQVFTTAQSRAVARQLIEELRHQHLLAVEASSEAGWHRIEVRSRQGATLKLAVVTGLRE